MSLPTHSGARQPPPNNTFLSSWAVQVTKSKPLVLCKGLTRKPTSKSTRSTCHSSKKVTVLQPNKNTAEVDSNTKDDLVADEDIYQALESDSDDEVLEALPKPEIPSRNKPPRSQGAIQSKSSQGVGKEVYHIGTEITEKRALSSPQILAEAKAIMKLYKHHKKMLVMMGSCTKLIWGLNRLFRCELRGTQVPDTYCLWLKSSVEAQNFKILRRTEVGEVSGGQDCKLGAAWKAMRANQKCVFHPWVFYTLSGLPASTSDIDIDHEENRSIDLSPEGCDELQGGNDNAVCSAKVCQAYAKASSAGANIESLDQKRGKSDKLWMSIYKEYWLLSDCTIYFFLGYYSRDLVATGVEGKLPFSGSYKYLEI
ncbi:hypothetical protein DFH28DRAFT_924716 [Melampsora americana]|nr:hypothetical protein DFH28DRAFT_924716 [Melampsora americana]